MPDNRGRDRETVHRALGQIHQLEQPLRLSLPSRKIPQRFEKLSGFTRRPSLQHFHRLAAEVERSRQVGGTQPDPLAQFSQSKPRQASTERNTVTRIAPGPGDDDDLPLALPRAY